MSHIHTVVGSVLKALDNSSKADIASAKRHLKLVAESCHAVKENIEEGVSNVLPMGGLKEASQDQIRSKKRRLVDENLLFHRSRKRTKSPEQLVLEELVT